MNKRQQRDLVGNKYGHLLVLKSLGNNGSGHYMSLVRCDCGKEYIVPDTELIYGRRLGCHKCSASNKIHGQTNTKLFNIWQSMKQRCNDKNCKTYKDYGGRGIKVCGEWENKFMNFYNWANANGYNEGLTIDRINNNGNYEPNNCQWVDIIQQANNKRNNVRVIYQNKEYTIAELSRKTNVDYELLRRRIKNGWNIENAIKEPAIKGRNQYWKSV